MSKKDKLTKQISITERLAMVVTQKSGEAAIDQAIQSLRREQTERIIEFTKATINRILEYEKLINDFTKWKEFQEKRLLAIKAGKFSQPQGKIIRFDNDSLNQDTF